MGGSSRQHPPAPLDLFTAYSWLFETGFQPSKRTVIKPLADEPVAEVVRCDLVKLPKLRVERRILELLDDTQMRVLIRRSRLVLNQRNVVLVDDGHEIARLTRSSCE